MTQKYTPEPWEVEGQFYDAHRIVDTNGVPICQFWYKDESPMPNQDANAARIIACVNACAGITDEQLKRLPEIIDEGTAALDECQRLRYDREELLNALKSIVDMNPKTIDGRVNCFSLAKMRAVMTLHIVEGGE